MVRKEYLDEFDEVHVLLPSDFPGYTMVNGGLFYDYYKINRWFAKNDEYAFKLTWEETQMIIDMFDSHDSDIATKLSEQLLQYAEGPK